MSGNMTLLEACALAVGILGGEPTARDVYNFLAADGWGMSRGSVTSTLHALRGAAVEVTEQGSPGYGKPSRYRQSEAARAWVREGERCG